MDEVSGSAWPVVKDNELLLKVFGRYPSFHDASVLSISMARAKRMRRHDPADGPVDPRRLEFVDVILEVLHREYRPAVERIGRSDYAVTIALLDVRSANIDVNAMLDDSFVSEISLRHQPDGLLAFDLEPNIGLDVRLVCATAEIRSIRPYRGAVLLEPNIVVFP